MAGPEGVNSSSSMPSFRKRLEYNTSFFLFEIYAHCDCTIRTLLAQLLPHCHWITRSGWVLPIIAQKESASSKRTTLLFYSPNPRFEGWTIAKGCQISVMKLNIVDLAKTRWKNLNRETATMRSRRHANNSPMSLIILVQTCCLAYHKKRLKYRELTILRDQQWLQVPIHRHYPRR